MIMLNGHDVLNMDYSKSLMYLNLFLSLEEYESFLKWDLFLSYVHILPAYTYVYHMHT